LSDVLHVAIATSFKLKEQINNLPILDKLVEDDLSTNIKLRNLAMNMKKEICGIIDYFFSLTKYDEMKAHNMLFLLLDSKYKSLKLISSFIGCEQGEIIVEKYDRRSMFPMLLKSYHHLHVHY
jgi:hypothetical protein